VFEFYTFISSEDCSSKLQEAVDDTSAVCKLNDYLI